MPSLSEIAPRLQKLLLMLSSQNSGEVINAARAIERTLREAGIDWHDLVGGLLPPAKVRTKSESKNRGSGSDWHVMVDVCIAHKNQLRLREQQFMTSLLHWHGELTERQHAWLVAIYRRVQREAAA
jgi:hypothetical protein